MLKIYFKILLLSLPAMLAVIVVANLYSKGFIDYYYSKITGEGKSMVIGTSRASQGIIPDSVIQGTKYESPMLNFAMSSFDSPYDEDYFLAIKKKLDYNVKNGIFILEIDISALCTDTSNPFKSQKLENLQCLHGDPNYEYLFKNINPFYKMIEMNNVEFPTNIQHKNGWLEVNLPLDSANVKTRTADKYKALKNNIAAHRFSEERMEYLEKTIELLKDHGKVILIKIPADTSIINLENKYFTFIDKKVEDLSKKLKVNYYDFTYLSAQYHYVDGNHLDKPSTILFCRELNKIILQNE